MNTNKKIDKREKEPHNGAYWRWVSQDFCHCGRENRAEDGTEIFVMNKWINGNQKVNRALRKKYCWGWAPVEDQKILFYTS